MKQIEYNNAAFGLRLELPHEWAAQTVSDVEITVKDTAANELLAATSATPWSAVGIQLDGAVALETDEITLEVSGAGAVPSLSPGDRLQIAASAGGPQEDVEVLFYTASTKTATLVRDLRYNHSDQATVVGLFWTYDLDTSTVADYPLGKQLVLTWDPDTDDIPVRERAEIANREFAIPGFEERFAALHPREYDAAMTPEVRLFRFLEEAHIQVGHELIVRGLLINRVVDQAILVPTLMAKVRWLILLNGDDRYQTERDVCAAEYQRQFELLCTAPIWADDDQDEVRESSEVEDHQQMVGFERGL
jgi:hypothetical protein